MHRQVLGARLVDPVATVVRTLLAAASLPGRPLDVRDRILGVQFRGLVERAYSATPVVAFEWFVVAILCGPVDMKRLRVTFGL
jgi:hypothetical protein